ncbi:MAG: B12-binding domain-containing radical SAM protein [Nitrospinae bacterium]|nr:B12-binding domain-containing radical SAM protein [Nitrospinota bacterium]
MRATLIAPAPPDISAFGARSLSAYLRSNGYETRVIFLPGSIGLLKEGGDYVYSYNKETLSSIARLCEGSALVGVSFMTSYYDRALQITEYLKSALPGVPLIWGGIHPSSKPEEALRVADMVCVGEGEEPLLKLMRRIEAGEELAGVEGIWTKKNGAVVKTPLHPLVKALDDLPYFDFSNHEHYVLDRLSGQMEPLTDELFKHHLPLLPYFDGSLIRAFRTMTDRGCPHMCSYCNVTNIKQMYKDDNAAYFRSRSVENAMAELVAIKTRYPFVEAIQFFDDTFFARPLKQIESFAELYKEKVGLPFYCQASPNTLSEAKLSALVNAGLVYVEMGVQTGSDRIKKMYHRNESNEKILEATRLLKGYVENGKLMPPDYHVIIDNPWETEEDTLATARLLYDIPKPYGLCISSLVFFPQTELYNKALEDGIIEDEMKEIYRKPFYVPPKRTYMNFIIYLLTFQRFPKSLVKLLMSDGARSLFGGIRSGFLYGAFYAMGETARLAAKGLSALRRGDLGRIAAFLRKLVIHDPLVAGRKQ